MTGPSLAPELLAQERTLETWSLEEAATALESTFRYERFETALAQISLDSDFRLSLEGHQYRVTEQAFMQLCHLLAIPLNFARGIPSDLVATVVERLKAMHQQSIVAVAHEDMVAGLVDPRRYTKTRAQAHRPHYEPVSGVEILSIVRDTWGGTDHQPLVTIADSGLSVRIVNQNTTIEPRVGDITRAGVILYSSETGGPMPQARGFTLRLTCTNGATAPASLGVVRFNTDWRVSRCRRLEAFAAAVRSFALATSLLENAYRRLASENLMDEAFYSVFRQARYVFRAVPDGERLTDTILGIPAERRLSIVSRVRRRHALARRGPETDLSPQLTDVPAWDVFNNITAAAKVQPPLRRLALEQLGGDIVRMYAPSRASGMAAYMGGTSE